MMAKRNFILGVVLVTLTSTSGAEAGLITYSDGAAHSLSTSTTNYYAITNGSSFYVTPGAAIMPPPALIVPNTAITGTGPSLINVSGGIVDGGDNASKTLGNGGDGIDSLNGTTTMISGGQIRGGAGGNFAGTGLMLSNAGATTISGGTITGGDASSPAGEGGVGIVFESSSQLIITGGTFSGGSGVGSSFAGLPAQSLVTLGGGNIEVYGGNFLSDIVTNYESASSRLDFFGSGLNYANGVLSGTLSSGDAIDQVVFGVNTSVVINASHTEVSFIPTTVPEPSSIAMIALGVGSVALFARCRRARAGGDRDRASRVDAPPRPVVQWPK